MDQDRAVKLIKDALAQGKTESEIVTLLREVGYVEPEIITLMAATKEAHPDNAQVQKIGPETVTALSASMPQPVQQPAQQAPAQEKKFPKKLVMAIAVIVLAIIAAAAYFFLFR